jgi:hypothetical protein
MSGRWRAAIHPHRFGQPFQPVAHEENIPDTAVAQVGEHAQPEPGALAAGAAHRTSASLQPSAVTLMAVKTGRLASWPSGP